MLISESISWQNANPSHQAYLQTLDSWLRPDANYSLKEEYPTLFSSGVGYRSLVYREGENLVAHVGYRVVEYQSSHYQLKLGLLGSVVVAPHLRGQGVGQEIIKEVLVCLEKEKVQLSLLWAEPEAFYSKSGFVRAGQEYSRVLSIHKCQSYLKHSLEYEVVENPSSEILFQLYLKQKQGVTRNLGEMKRLLEIPKLRSFLIEKENRPVAYALVHKGADFENYVHEWMGDEEDVVHGLSHIQSYYFTSIPLTVISPVEKRSKNWEEITYLQSPGVLGWFYLHEREALEKIWKSAIDTSELTDQQLVREVFGWEEVQEGKLPFFLWGLDSI